MGGVRRPCTEWYTYVPIFSKNNFESCIVIDDTDSYNTLAKDEQSRAAVHTNNYYYYRLVLSRDTNIVIIIIIGEVLLLLTISTIIYFN